MEFRWIGIVFVMAGSICSGIWYRMRYVGRLENLRECSRAVSILRGEIAYGRTPLPEACREVEIRVCGICRTFFRRVGERLEKDAASTGEIWQTTAQELFSPMQMQPQEREEWIRLGSTLGYLDAAMQLRTLDLYLQRLQTSIDQAEKDRPGRTRMYPLLGTFGGVLICLVLA